MYHLLIGTGFIWEITSIDEVLSACLLYGKYNEQVD